MALQDDLKKAKAALRDAKTFAYKGKTYSRTELRDELIPQLEKGVKAELAEEKVATQIISVGKQNVSQAESDLKIKQDRLNRTRNAFAKNNASESELAKSEQDVLDAQQKLDNLRGTKTVTTTTKLPAAGSPEAVAAARARLRTESRGPAPVTTPVTEPVTTPNTTADAAPTKGAGGGKKPVAAGTGPLGLTAKSRADIVKQFPQFSSSFDGGEGEQAFIDFFGQDAADLIVKAGTTDAYGYLLTETGLAAYRRDFENTAYGQRTNQAQQDFDVNPKNQAVLIKAKQDEITKSYADLQLTETQLKELARDAARNAYTGDALRFSVYNYAYKGNQTTATESALADQIRAAGRSYGYTVSEDKLKAALTGTAFNGRMVTQESLLQEAQAAAKGQYGHLADQIDSGLTLDDIFYNYKTFAAKTLGVDPSEIDYSNDSRFAEAFGTKQTGQLSLNDWVYKLKSDKRYGYQFSPQAQQEVASMVSTLEKAFGFRQ